MTVDGRARRVGNVLTVATSMRATTQHGNKQAPALGEESSQLHDAHLS